MCSVRKHLSLSLTFTLSLSTYYILLKKSLFFLLILFLLFRSRARDADALHSPPVKSVRVDALVGLKCQLRVLGLKVSLHVFDRRRLKSADVAFKLRVARLSSLPISNAPLSTALVCRRCLVLALDLLGGMLLRLGFATHDIVLVVVVVVVAMKQLLLFTKMCKTRNAETHE